MILRQKEACDQLVESLVRVRVIGTASSSLHFGAEGQKSNVHALIQCGCNPVEHGQRMSLIVGIFDAADDCSGGADEPGQLSLRKPGIHSQAGFVPLLA